MLSVKLKSIYFFSERFLLRSAVLIPRNLSAWQISFSGSSKHCLWSFTIIPNYVMCSRNFNWRKKNSDLKLMLLSIIPHFCVSKRQYIKNVSLPLLPLLLPPRCAYTGDIWNSTDLWYQDFLPWYTQSDEYF